MPDCPTPDRAIYATEGAAWAGIRRGALIGTHGNYRCAAGHWHIAPADEARRKRMAGRA